MSSLRISSGTENSRDDVIVLRNYDVIRLFSKPAIIRFQVLLAEVFGKFYGVGLIRSADATSFSRRMGPMNLKWLNRLLNSSKLTPVGSFMVKTKCGPYYCKIEIMRP